MATRAEVSLKINILYSSITTKMFPNNLSKKVKLKNNKTTDRDDNGAERVTCWLKKIQMISRICSHWSTQRFSSPFLNKIRLSMSSQFRIELCSLLSRLHSVEEYKKQFSNASYQSIQYNYFGNYLSKSYQSIQYNYLGKYL